MKEEEPTTPERSPPSKQERKDLSLLEYSLRAHKDNLKDLDKNEEIPMNELHASWPLTSNLRDRIIQEEREYINEKMAQRLAQVSPVKQFIPFDEFSKEPRELSWEEYEKSWEGYVENWNKKV